MKTYAHKIGAVMYFIWGLLHLKAAYSVYQLGTSLEVFQDAWNLLFFALVGIIVAVIFNWNNSRLGYWINLITVSVSSRLS